MAPADNHAEEETPKRWSAEVKLREPIEFGKDESGKARLIETLVLKPSSRAFKEYSMPMKQDGTMLYQPYELARVGLQMAGFPASLVDKIYAADMLEVAQEVLGFIGVSQRTGNSESQ